MEINLLDVVNESFSTYAAMTIQNRALIDARDAVKPSARQCMYSQLLEKTTYKKPYEKSAVSVANAGKHFYVHGEEACYNLLVRLGRSYNMRYVLEDFDGQGGTLTDGRPAAQRYTDMRLGKLGVDMFEGIDKECIDIWFDNYSDKEQFPSVLPSLGYYNICNGSLGIATSLSSSIPQFNIKEVNEAMIKLLWDRDIDFDEIYCPPDFCTAGTILNSEQVKEYIKNGCGGSIRMRSTATYIEAENALLFNEIPYGVYVKTITDQIAKLVNEGEILGIAKDGVKDQSTSTYGQIKIFLEKGINVNKVLKKLFKLTSLENFYSVNMVMLDRGVSPKIFTWREALLAHIEHEIEVRTKIHEYELSLIPGKINIAEGIVKALSNLDNIIATIRGSKDKTETKNKMLVMGFNEEQIDAILKITLSKLTKMEVNKYIEERDDLIRQKEYHEKVLSNNDLLYQEIEKGFRDKIEEYGDERRTKLLNLDFTSEDEDAEPIEKKELLIHYTNLGNIYTSESTTLMRTRRGTKGSKVKLATNEVITQTIRDNNFSSLLVFTNKGIMYHIATDDLPLNSKINIAQLFEFKPDEKPTALTTIQKRDNIDYFIFITKQGMVKKTLAKEYNVRKGRNIKAINLKEGDEVIKVLFVNNEDISLLTNNGNFVRFATDEITPIGRAAAGVKGVKLNEGDFIISAYVTPAQGKFLVTASENGIVKKTSLDEYPIGSRAIKGKKISEVKDKDKIIDYLILNEDHDIIIIVNKKAIKINTSELRELSRSAIGVKGVDLKDNEKVIGLIQEDTE